MPKFFYIDANGQKQGLVSEQQLQALAANGAITPTTPLQTEGGHQGVAGQIPGLFAASQQPMATSMATNDSSPTGIRPLSAELLGMKPEVLFTFMYIASLFATTIIGFFIPIILWALTKEKDKRADLHGKLIIALMIVREFFGIMMFVFLLLSTEIEIFFVIAFPSAIMVIVILVFQIICTIKAATGKVPTDKNKWVYCPSPAASAVQQHTAVPTTSTSSVDEIKKMKELLDCGAISQQEFDAFKRKTLGI